MGSNPVADNKKRCEICSKLTIKTSEGSQWHRSRAIIVNFERISHLFLFFLLLTLSWVPAAEYLVFLWSSSHKSALLPNFIFFFDWLFFLLINYVFPRFSFTSPTQHNFRKRISRPWKCKCKLIWPLSNHPTLEHEARSRKIS